VGSFRICVASVDITLADGKDLKASFIPRSGGG
jgi:hypothetical protein